MKITRKAVEKAQANKEKWEGKALECQNLISTWEEAIAEIGIPAHLIKTIEIAEDGQISADCETVRVMQEA